MSNILPLAIISGLMICLVTLINTDFALIILIFSMLLSPEFTIGAIPGRPLVVRIDDILLIIVFFTWLAKLAMNKELGLLKRTWLNLPIAIYIALLAISTLWGIMIGRVNLLKSTFYLLKYIEYYMLFFMVTNSIKNQRQIKVFIFFILLTSLITSIYALNSVKYYGRATAPFEFTAGEAGEPNTLGGYLVLISAIIAGLWLYSKNILSRLSLGTLAILIIFTLGQTLSRGSYLGFIAMFLALAILTKRNKLMLIILLVLFIFTGKSVLPEKVIKRISETFVPGRVYEPWGGTRITLDDSASARVESWKNVLEKWENSPILGYGVTGAGFIDTQYPLVLAEAGLLGLSVFIWLIVTIFRESLRKFKAIKDDYFCGLTLGFLAGFVGLLFHSFSAATFVVIRIMEPFWFLAAVVMMLPEVPEVPDSAKLTDEDVEDVISASEPPVSGIGQ